MLRGLLINALEALAEFAEKYRALPTLSYTHFQAAQPTTVGKRACLWANDLLFDLKQLNFQLDNLALLGCKGATGTGASFLELFDGDEGKVEALEKRSRPNWALSTVRLSAGRPTAVRRTSRFYRYSAA